jgi:RNAse (barnase) inhibitor barstar
VTSPSVLTRRELTGPYLIDATRVEQIQRDIVALGFACATLKPGDAKTPATWLVEVGRQLNLPPHYGANFDALYDCLCDPDCLPDARFVLFIDNPHALGESGCDTLIAVLQAVADEWRDAGRSFWALLDAPGLDLARLPT